jgi:hypothetical protein
LAALKQAPESVERRIANQQHPANVRFILDLAHRTSPFSLVAG